MMGAEEKVQLIRKLFDGKPTTTMVNGRPVLTGEGDRALLQRIYDIVFLVSPAEPGDEISNEGQLPVEIQVARLRARVARLEDESFERR